MNTRGRIWEYPVCKHWCREAKQDSLSQTATNAKKSKMRLRLGCGCVCYLVCSQTHICVSHQSFVLITVPGLFYCVCQSQYFSHQGLCELLPENLQCKALISKDCCCRYSRSRVSTRVSTTHREKIC